MEDLIIREVNVNEMTMEQINNIMEQAKERKVSLLENNVNQHGKYLKRLEDKLVQYQKDLKAQEKTINTLNETVIIFKEEINKVQKETESVTKTLLTHGSLKRELDNYIHRIIYNELTKDSLRDELFHGTLSRNCKAHIVKALDVSSYPYVRVEDLDTAKKLSNKCLSSVNIHNMMKKESERLMIKLENSNSDNSKTGTYLARKFELLDKLLDEVGGNINAI